MVKRTMTIEQYYGIKISKIEASCCAIGSGVEEVHVLKENCPIQRKEGQRSCGNKEEVTCVYKSIFNGLVTPPCKYYQGCYKSQAKATKSKNLVKCSCGV